MDSKDLKSYRTLSEETRFTILLLIYFLYKGKGRLVLRKGWRDWGVLDHAYPLFASPDRPEYDNEHEGGCAFFAFLLFELFPEYTHRYKRAEVYELLLTHDFGEIASGDVSDDGNRDEVKKDAEELSVFLRIFGNLTPGFTKLVKNFRAFQKKNTLLGRFAYCIDKSEAILQALIYEYAGFPGSIRYKRVHLGLTKQDEQNFERTKSEKTADNWLDSVLPKLKKNDPTGVDFFERFLKFALDAVRSNYFNPEDSFPSRID
ncbi:HD domain-containing protein [Candidatus Saccharibacteria bacterium]|nr:HD domain-containing protein [Candidatus Saccharibacteria bacterium]